MLTTVSVCRSVHPSIVKCCVCSKGFWESPDADCLIVIFRDSLSAALLRTETIRVETAGFRERVRCFWAAGRASV